MSTRPRFCKTERHGALYLYHLVVVLVYVKSFPRSQTKQVATSGIPSRRSVYTLMSLMDSTHPTVAALHQGLPGHSTW